MATTRHRGTRAADARAADGACVTDIVPPGHAQLLVVAYPTSEAYGYKYQMTYGDRIQCESTHFPALDDQDELHRPFFIGCT